MANQDLILYTYHAGREGVEAGGTIFASDVKNADLSPIVDGRQAEILLADVDLGTGTFAIQPPVEQNALSDAINILIVSGHNMTGANIAITGETSGDILLSPEVTISELARFPIVVPLTASVNAADTHIRATFSSNGPEDGITPEMTEIFFTTAHLMKRPGTGWDHGTRQAQRRFESQSGASSTWLLGRARQLYRFTWDRLTGADLTILLNLRPQTNDFTEPFWIQPPDDSFPIAFVEIDRDADWQQMFEAPLAAGLGHRVTLPLIEVVA